MWPTIKQHLKEFNVWFDKRTEQVKLGSLIVFVLLSTLFVNSDSVITSLFGFALLISAAGQRWMFINGKL